MRARTPVIAAISLGVVVAALLGAPRQASAASTPLPGWLRDFEPTGALAGDQPVIGPDGMAWLTLQEYGTSKYDVDTVSRAGNRTVAVVDSLYTPVLKSGPDGDMWAVTYPDGSPDEGWRLSRIGMNGTMITALTSKTHIALGVSGGGVLWGLEGDTPLAIDDTGSVRSYSVPNLYGSQLWAAADGALWSARSAASTAFTRVAPDGTTTELPDPLPAARPVLQAASTSDGALWVVSEEGDVGWVKPDGSSKTVLTGEPATWSRRQAAIAASPVDDSIWLARTAKSDGSATEVSRIDETAAQPVHVTVPYAMGFGLGNGAPPIFVDSSDRLWYTEFLCGPATLRAHLASIDPAGLRRTYDPPPGDLSYYSEFAEAPDGTVWASSTDPAALNTSISIDHFDAATGTTEHFPVPPGVEPWPNLVVDSGGDPWLSYIHYSGTAATGEMIDDQAYYGTTPPISSTRVAGTTDRYTTSVAVSQHSYPHGAPVVYVVSGQNYPDGLSADPAAAASGGPVLLTTPGSVPTEVAAEIKRLNPGKIVVVGGTPSVSANAFAQLKAIRANTVRVAGVDRYSTSRAVAEYAFGTSGTKTAYLADGRNFPDALSAAGAAGAAGAAVILVPGSATTLDPATTSLLRRLGVTSVNVLGDTKSTSAGIAAAAAKIAPTHRLAGADRYSTSVAIANSIAGSSGTAWQSVYVVSGQNYPDALSAGAWAAATDHPIVLAPFDGLTQQLSDDLASRHTAGVVVVGGTPSLSWAVAGLQVRGTTLETPNAQ